MLSTLMQPQVQLESGRYCRRCGAAISPHDTFGFGEGLCPACRR